MDRRFKVGQKVRVIGCGDKVFEVIGYHQDLYFYKGRMIQQFKYALVCLSANIPECWISEEAMRPEIKQKLSKRDIDDMLDCYIEYMSLYEFLGLEEYKQKADELIEELKQYELEVK
jgi:hypothetical protein